MRLQQTIGLYDILQIETYCFVLTTRSMRLENDDVEQTIYNLKSLYILYTTKSFLQYRIS